MKRFMQIMLLSSTTILAVNVLGQQLGINPIPVVKGISVQTGITFDNTGNTYTYSYAVTNPASNTGSIWNIQIDLTAPPRFLEDIGTNLTIPRGAAGNLTFEDVYQTISSMTTVPLNGGVVPFGITAPLGWGGSLTVNGTGGFVATNTTSLIVPGQTIGNFNLLSHGVPMLRVMQVIPDWDLDTENDEATENEAVQAAQIKQSLINNVYVLGPSATPYDDYDQFDVFDQLQKDVATAVQIGWIPDPSLAQLLPAELQSARSLFDTQGVDYNVYSALTNILYTVTSATPGKLTPNAYELLYFDLTKLLHDFGTPPPSPTQPPQPPPPTPIVTITNPASHVLSLVVGATASITAHVVDQANNDAPLTNYSVPFSIDIGPDVGTTQTLTTDKNGNVTFTYIGHGTGVDTVAIHQDGFSLNGSVTPNIIAKNPLLDSASVIWSGGADLIVAEFTPPTMVWDGHSQIHVTDDTKNIGDTAEELSTTQYYLSTQAPVDPTTAAIVGQRPVPALSPGQDSFYEGDFAFPLAYQQPGKYYLTACANGDRAVVETNYNNNCTVREIVMTLQPSIDCSKTGPTISELWPPNHKMVDVGIMGVVTPNNIPSTITITGIQQDEPVEEPGSGNTEPDGAGLGASVAQVRSERSGTGAGRIYFISFNAATNDAGSCSGTVQVVCSA